MGLKKKEDWKADPSARRFSGVTLSAGDSAHPFAALGIGLTTQIVPDARGSSHRAEIAKPAEAGWCCYEQCLIQPPL